MSGLLFLNLTTFSQTGGIEKFNRCLIKALRNLSASLTIDIHVSSVYDSKPDIRYIQPVNFAGHMGNKYFFVPTEIYRARKFNTIIIGHINLALIAIFIKLFYRGKRIIIAVHGVEATEQLSWIKNKALKICDDVWVVSEFTKKKLLLNTQIEPQKIKVIFNTIDPYFNLPTTFNKPEYLLKRYQIAKEEKVLFTLTRLSHKEGYKGYDKVIRALPTVLKKIPRVRYLIAGKADSEEINYVTHLIKDNNLQNHVTLTGFLPDAELTDHYLLSDLFVMPSKKEGFGIVFIEALTCGLSVVAGNKDGSVDALKKGELGVLIDPDNVNEIADAIITELESALESEEVKQKQKKQEKVLSYFGFPHFENAIKTCLESN
ncbi:MAG TPA: glycosyltransferase family 4 protein [Chitinophagaceae bacterium]|nr:glycosyltransferase family 4 protein [Chitinophagaceae bacterium]